MPQDQFLSEGQYADLQRQSRIEDHTLALCCIVGLNTLDRVE